MGKIFIKRGMFRLSDEYYPIKLRHRNFVANLCLKRYNFHTLTNGIIIV